MPPQAVYAKITAQGRPRHLISGTPYRGVNVWRLSGQGGSPFWVTSRHAVPRGRHVNKGAKGTTVMFWTFPARKGGE